LIEDAGRVLFNCYVPIQVPCAEGDPEPFLRHLRLLLPNERDRAILLAFMARCVQSPGLKIRWCPVIQGVQGNGKTLLADVMIQALSERYCHKPKAKEIGNKFNAWVDRKLFACIEEIYVSDNRELIGTLMDLIANDRVEIERKGVDGVMGDNRVNFMAFTNHKDAVPKTLDDRRYCLLFTAQQTAGDLVRDGMGGLYLPNLYAWLRDGGYAIVTHYLRGYAIPVELDPAGAMHRAPATSSTAEAIAASLGPVEQAVLEAIGNEDTGFRGLWVSSTHLSALLESRRLLSRCPPNNWDAMLRNLGYIRHPALPGGRLNVAPACDGGKKSRLWVKAESIPALNLDTPAAVAAAYSAANGTMGTDRAGVA
jgi:hypothetical protein